MSNQIAFGYSSHYDEKINTSHFSNEENYISNDPMAGIIFSEDEAIINGLNQENGLYQSDYLSFGFNGGWISPFNLIELELQYNISKYTNEPKQVTTT